LINIAGTNDIKVNLASCCKPIIGDRITGFITKGSGITIHRMVCPNISDSGERVINAKWNNVKVRLESAILIRVDSSKNLLIDVISKAANNDIPVKRFSISKSDLIKMTILVEGKEELMKLINAIEMIPGVLDVQRVIE